MATYTTTEYDKGSATARTGLGYNLVYDKFDLSAALALNDVIRFTYLPKRAVLADCWICTDDLDTHATPTITLTARVNDTSTQKNFFAASTVAQAGGLQRASIAAGNAIGYELTSSSFFFELLVAAGPATGAASGDIEVFIAYTMDLIIDDQ